MARGGIGRQQRAHGYSGGVQIGCCRIAVHACYAELGRECKVVMGGGHVKRGVPLRAWGS